MSAPALGRTGGGIGLAQRMAALELACRSGEGRLDDALLARASAVLGTAQERVALAAEHTVVALAGATGSGKSSLLNALAGEAVATVGVLRPTTAEPLAVVWEAGGGADAGRLLDWLGVRVRHGAQGSAPTVREAAGAAPAARAGVAAPAAPATPAPTARAGAPAATPAPAGLVLLDLPDHDSVVAEHRERADRLVGRADLLVWVLDPQKYADAALHERYLRPLAGHAGVMVLVLNQADRLTSRDRDACLADVRRLAREDGLGDVEVLAVSAATGEGVDELRALLAGAVRRREAATARTAADVRAAAREVLAACGSGEPERSSRTATARLTDALAQAAGADAVVDAVRRSSLRGARAATGWPPTRWAGSLRRDPLHRLGVGRDVRGAARRAAQDDAERTARGSVLEATPAAAGARVAVREYVRTVARGAPDAWLVAVGRRAQDASARLPSALDAALDAARPGAARRPGWWRVVGAAQWVLLAVAAAGALWLGAFALLGYLQLAHGSSPSWHGVPWPTLLLVGGVVAGLVVAGLSRAAAGLGARRRARSTGRRLREAVASVADELVRVPVADELAGLSTCRTSAAIAAS